MTDVNQLLQHAPVHTLTSLLLLQGPPREQGLDLASESTRKTPALGINKAPNSTSDAGQNFGRSVAEASAPKGVSNSSGAHLQLHICGIKHLQRHIWIHCSEPRKPAPRGAVPCFPLSAFSASVILALSAYGKIHLSYKVFPSGTIKN